MIASLQEHALKNDHLKLLGSSATLNQKASKRQRLQRALMAKREGAILDDLEELEVEVERPNDNLSGDDEGRSGQASLSEVVKGPGGEEDHGGGGRVRRRRL